MLLSAPPQVLFGFQHYASNHTMAWPGPNLVPEMKELTLQDPQPQMMWLLWKTQAPDITWGMLKRTTQEQILLQTQTPFTSDNLFLGCKAGIRAMTTSLDRLVAAHICTLQSTEPDAKNRKGRHVGFQTDWWCVWNLFLLAVSWSC
nr:uncharacterized protein LOC119619065 [Chlorocebus sabaeus]